MLFPQLLTLFVWDQFIVGLVRFETIHEQLQHS